MTNSKTPSEWETRVEAGFFKMTVEFAATPALRHTLIMACRPVDPTQFPKVTHVDSAELERNAPRDDTWTELPCRCCELPVLMGPRQRTNYELDPAAFTVLCFLCSARAVGNRPVTITSSGGK